MKRLQSTHRRPLRGLCGGAGLPARPGGAVIVVVLTLLASLAFLGFFFYSWSDQEARSARAFAFERSGEESGVDPQNFIDDALRQILVSTPDERLRSALHGGQWTVSGTTVNVSDKSLLAHVIGLIRADGTPLDVRPRDGRGIGVYATGVDANNMPVAMNSSQVVFDYNGDYDGTAGTLDADGTTFRINNSLAANNTGGFANPFERAGTPFENHRPDVDYTYPDINAQFLAYDAVLPDGTRVIIPSYFRPQLFPDRRSGGFMNLYTDAATAAQVLRPHQEHRNADTSLRYIDPVNWPTGRPAQSGDLNRVIAPFPFTVDADNNLVPNEMGVFSGTAQYDLDVDADGDGVLDSIWLDLDYPIIDLADGRQAVPLFYVKIIDGDALLNLNHHGHTPLFTAASNGSSADPFTQIYQMTGDWVHSSHLGMSPAEVNPLPALRADPADPAYVLPADVAAATLQHRGWYSDQSTGPPTDRTSGFTRVQMANTELARLLYGSPEYSSDLTYANANPGSDLPGRYGEAVVGGVPVLRMALHQGSGVFPQAGATGFDDDGDGNDPGRIPPTAPADNFASGITHTDDFGGLMAPPLTIPPSVHPLDFTGLGNYAPVGRSYRGIPGVGGVRDLRGGVDPSNPSRWLYYGFFNAGTLSYEPALWQNQDSGAFPINGITPWTQATGVPFQLQNTTFVTGSPYDGLWNENDEIVTDASFPTQVDAPFPPSELFSLQLSDADWQLAGAASRLRKLASFNFEANRQAAAIRQQFTTDSRDRLEHGHARVSGGRAWEFNDVATGTNRFPPMFDPAGAFGGPFTSRHENGPGGVNPFDPFRPVTRRLLTIEENNQQNIGGFRDLPGQRLNLNRLLVHFDQNGNPIYRHLIPHANFEITDSDANGYLVDAGGNARPMSHAHPPHVSSYYSGGELDPPLPAPVLGGFPAVPFSAIATDRFAQEAWARYDRQRLARDIYVLLYTLGGPDAIDPTDPSAPKYTAAMVQQMAQFAVNYVDALDQDDVITRFEYDADLSDGWSDPPNPLGVVYGVESQQLAFSEVLLVQQPSQTSDNDGTLHDESSVPQQEHRWLYIELRNASPFTVPLKTGSYRIARYAQNETQPTGTAPVIAYSRFTTHPSGNFKQIGPGQNFIVACHDGTVVNAGGVQIPSDFYANIDDTTPGLESIIPDSGTVVAGTSDDPISSAGAPHADLDLVVTDAMGAFGHEGYYENTLPAAPGVALVEPDPANTGAPVMAQFRLERRLNTLGAGFGEAVWVEVDRIEVEGKVVQPAGSSSSEIITALSNATSFERRQPFNDFANDYISLTGTEVRKHTLDSRPANKHLGNSQWGSANGGDRTAPFTLWQPHFNRDFSSVYELFSVPAVGPDRLIRAIHDGGRNRLSGWADSTPVPHVPFTAGTIFRHPDGDTDGDGTPDPGAVPNRWYRLLEFIEYPPRTHDTIRDRLSLRRRTDGRINLNTLRHEAVMAGLVDDLVQLADTSSARPATDRHDGGRNWFDQLLVARDGVDPFTGRPLPGVPGAFPFRSLSYINPQSPDDSLMSTILRRHRPSGGGPADALGLFEARGSSDVGSDNVDYHTRNRLLAKIANNTTNRSHVFAIWIGYELFEAHQPNPAMPDVVQIGARIDDIPGHREFVVVDMTRLEEAYFDSDPTDPVPGRFDFRKFIIYRKRIK